ncbi:MAG: TerB family tellurite resistance protein [Planctomycetota bacterium]|nr:TerB family tellurite resistance protein [Planctomycetota bacterium]
MKQLDHLKNLVIMASADGSLTEREIALLVDRCAQLGLGEKDMEKALEFALSSQAVMKLPTEHAEQIAILSDLIRVMAADGSLSDVEKRLFSLAAAKMEIDRDEIEELIDNLVGPHKRDESEDGSESNAK